MKNINITTMWVRASCCALGMLTVCLSSTAQSSCETAYSRVQWNQALSQLAEEPFLEWETYVLPRSVSALSDSEWINMTTSTHRAESRNTVFLAVDTESKPQAVVKVARSRQETGSRNLVGSPEIEAGGLAKREVLAYRIDQDLLKFGLVPYTTLGKTSGGHLVTLQKFEEGMKLTADSARQAKVSRLDAQRKIVFDALMGHYDRHLGNFLVNADGKLILIDNGSCMTRTGSSANAHHSDWMRHFPQATGQVEESVKQTLLNLDEQKLKDLLDEFRIPLSAQHDTLQRLEDIKKILQKDAASIDEIARHLRPKPTTRARLKSDVSKTIMNPLHIGGAFIAGGALTYILLKIHEKDQSPAAAPTEP